MTCWLGGCLAAWLSRVIQVVANWISKSVHLDILYSRYKNLLLSVGSTVSSATQTGRGDNVQ